MSVAGAPLRVLGAFLLAASLAPAPGAQNADPGTVLERIVLDDLVAPFQRTWGTGDRFGSGMAALGDLDGDGLEEFAVGAPGDDLSRGAVWIFSLTAARTVARFVKLGPEENLPFELGFAARFGSAMASLDDFDGDGVGDIAVGAPGPLAGAVHLLFLRTNGRIDRAVRLDRDHPLLAPHLTSISAFGSALARLGDLDGDGIDELAVGAPGSDAVLVLSFAADGELVAVTRIGSAVADFGRALAPLGDLDGDGVADLVVGRFSSSEVLFLAPDGSVVTRRTIGGPGAALARIGDVDGDGVTDIAVGRPIQVLLLRADGTVKRAVALPGTGNELGSAFAGPGDTDGDGRLEVVAGAPASDVRIANSGSIHFYDLLPSGAADGSPQVIDAASSGIPIAPSQTPDFDQYGSSIAPLGDLNADGFPDVAVGAPFDDDGGTDTGAVWIHFLRAGLDGTRVNKISRTQDGLALPPNSHFGRALAYLGDLDGNGVGDLAVGVPSASGPGAIHVLFLRSNGELLSTHVIDGLAVVGVTGQELGIALAALGDLDGDGVTDLAASATNGNVYVLFLAADGSVRSQRTLSGLPWIALAYMGRAADSGRRFLAAAGPGMRRIELDSSGQVVGSVAISASTSAIGAVGDLDGNGAGDLVSFEVNRIVVRFLRPDGSVLGTRSAVVGFGGLGLASLGDLTGDGIPDLAAGFIPLGSALSSRVLLLQMGGIATAGFEHRDVAGEAPLENGRQIPVPHPGRTFVISSAGANLGATVFDSTPLGPNDPSQDRDLLVDSGMVLMLQDSLVPTQTVPGVFDRPNDDADGGLLAFDFPGLVRPHSLELADIDGGASASVTLRDAAGRVRIYDVPARFTEDRVNEGGTGLRKLDLTTLAPQPGFAASATAAEETGFDPARVVRIEVALGGSGAIDDLIYDPYP